MAHSAKKKRPMPPTHVRQPRPKVQWPSLGASPGRNTAIVEQVVQPLRPPYMQPDAVAKGGPARQDARYREQGGGVQGYFDGPPGSGPNRAAPVHLPGGAVMVDALQHPTFQTIERMYRRLPEEGMFDDITPTRPFGFELGSYKVPQQMTLWLTDLEFSILRLSGADPGDFVYAEQGRFSGQVLFDVQQSGGTRTEDLGYQLDPAPIVSDSQFRQSDDPAGGVRRFPAPQAVFDDAAAATFGNTSGEGNSGLPVRSQPPGPRRGPFTMIVPEGQVIALRCSLFRELQSPVAAFEGRFAGYLLPAALAKALQNRMAPQ